jgi:hypothetical protein
MSARLFDARILHAFAHLQHLAASQNPRIHRSISHSAVSSLIECLALPMDTLLALFEKSPRAISGLNLIACAIGVAWIVGLSANSKLSRLGWVGFWVATGAFYLLETVHPDLHAARVGLYASTVCLLCSFDPAGRATDRPRTWWMVTAIFVVGGAAAADALGSAWGYETGWHQLLTAIVIGAWAWRARQVDLNGSMVITIYALVQLPVRQVLVSGGLTQASQAMILFAKHSRSTQASSWL